MRVRYIEKLFPESAAFVHYGFPFFGSVGYGDDRQTGAFEVFQCFDCLFDGLLRQYAWTCCEIMNLFHVIKIWGFV